MNIQFHIRGPRQEEVARRAYELYQARGEEPGHELDDWLQAEREINQHREVDDLMRRRRSARCPD